MPRFEPQHLELGGPADRYLLPSDAQRFLDRSDQCLARGDVVTDTEIGVVGTGDVEDQLLTRDLAARLRHRKLCFGDIYLFADAPPGIERKPDLDAVVKDDVLERIVGAAAVAFEEQALADRRKEKRAHRGHLWPALPLCDGDVLLGHLRRQARCFQPLVVVQGMADQLRERPGRTGLCSAGLADGRIGGGGKEPQN